MMTPERFTWFMAKMRKLTGKSNTIVTSAGEIADIEKALQIPTEKNNFRLQARAETLVDQIRAWRKMLLDLPQAKEAAREVEVERELRKEMGTALGGVPVTLRVDGKNLMYKPKSILGPEDFEGAWKSLLPTLGEEDRKRATTLLQRKSHRISHEFVTE